MSSPASSGRVRALLLALSSGAIVFLIAQAVWGAVLWKLYTHPAGWELGAMATFLVCGIAWLRFGPWPLFGRAFRREGLRFNRVRLAAFLPALVAGWSTMIAGFCLYAAHRAASGLGGESPVTLPAQAHGAWLFAGLLMSGSVAGVVEEIAFRGFMQGILEKRFPAAAAIVVTGFFWGLVHLNHAYFGEETFLWFGVFLAVAAILGTIAHRTNSVLPGIVVHAGFDSTYFLVAGLLQPRIAPLAFVQSLAAPSTLRIVAACAVVVAAVAWRAFFASTRSRPKNIAVMARRRGP
ncbi:MAG TPA: type II CAAX endopeptidase family protein [Rhizomicrobium sp.]|jgi:membrane protease YdiL (CAAX protease family)